jgi:large subunit ribosomal protein L9
MKVILTENLDNLGHIGDIVKVAPGYARNYLIPRGYAILATEGNEKALAHARRQLEYKKNRILEGAKGVAAKIEALSLTIPHQAGEEGKLFGSVTNMEVAQLLAAQGIEIDRKKIDMEPIKHTGEFTATVKLHPEVTASLKLNVVAA